MPRPTRFDTRSRAVRGIVLVALVSVGAALSAVAPTDDSPAAARAPQSAPARTAPPVVSPGATAAPATGQGAGQGAADAPPAAVAPRPAVATMSMDEPIQGGLTAHQAQAVSATVLAAHDEPPTATARDTWTPAMGRTAAARARSWLGMPYSWAGGTGTGPTTGRCDPGAGADLDCRIVGFDCSGLTMYAWGPYASLPHFAQTQREAGFFHPSLTQLRPGDLVFFAGYLPDGIGHVAVYEGDGMVIEAPQSGAVVRRSPLRELLANDGAYRGAVRPSTPRTPGFTSDATVSTRGGIVTLRGEHLAGVTSLAVGERTVTRFVRHTDSALTFRVPAAAAGRVAVTARTSWGALADPVRLTYVRPAVRAAPPRTTAPVGPVSPVPPRTPPATPPKTPPSTVPTTGPPGGATGPAPTSPPVGSPAPSPTTSPTTSSAPVSA